VPLHRQRLRQRGFNQSLLLARVIGSGLSIKVDFTSLQRTRVTEPQVNLSSEEREGNVKGAFTVKDPSAFRGKRVLLVDDVLTTGATITECGKALKASGAEVFALTLARTVMV
jgi:ComF family protein